MTPDKVKEYRKAFGVTIEGFSAMLRTDPRNIRRWESATQDIPKWLDLYLPFAYAAYCGTPVEKLRNMVLDPDEAPILRIYDEAAS